MSLDHLPDSFTHGDYEFRKASRADLPTIRKWLDAHHLGEWWTPGEDELGAVMAGEAGLSAYIVIHQGWPFAYVQVADPAFDPVLSEQVDFPKGAIRFDQFIGDTNMIGFGHGIKFIKALVAAMRGVSGVTRLIVLPAKENVFAARSYSQCGFRTEKTLDLGKGPLMLMSQNVT